jgi:hypothetical protein
MMLDEITSGSPYGATTIAGGDGLRPPTANELQGARYQGRKTAGTANKLGENNAPSSALGSCSEGWARQRDCTISDGT